MNVSRYPDSLTLFSMYVEGILRVKLPNLQYFLLSAENVKKIRSTILL